MPRGEVFGNSERCAGSGKAPEFRGSGDWCRFFGSLTLFRYRGGGGRVGNFTANPRFRRVRRNGGDGRARGAPQVVAAKEVATSELKNALSLHFTSEVVGEPFLAKVQKIGQVGRPTPRNAMSHF